MCKFDLNVTETGFRFIAKYLILIMHASYWPSYLKHTGASVTKQEFGQKR